MLKRPTISVYLISMNMVLLGLLFPSFSYLLMQEVIHLRDTQLERNIATIRQSLAIRSASLVRSTALSAKEAVAGFDFTFLQNLLTEVNRDDPGITSCMVLDINNTVVAHSDHSQIGSTAPASKIIAQAPARAYAKYTPEVSFYWPEDIDAGGIMTASFPIYSGDFLWGAIRCDYSLAEVSQQIDQAKDEWTLQLQQVKRYFLVLLTVFLSAGFAIAILLTRSFVRTTHVLHRGVQQVASGALDQEISEHGVVCEEFAGLVAAFNTMTGRLRDSQHQLEDYSRSLEGKVLERTRDLEEAQRIMVQQAHEAGLAEMAVGVLHNIGNAITPAQVAATVLSNQLADSPLRVRLEPSLKPLRESLEGGRDLSPQERQRSAALLRHLPASLNEEFDRAIRELKDIRDKHHHIETIIKLQMRYAQITEHTGLVDTAQLAQDAIHIAADAIAKRHIALTLKLEETPPVRTEKSKLLQVMINLIKNGYEAMDDIQGGTREMTISTGVRRGAPDQVMFSVKDSGCGFTAEDKEQLFAFGYSTKERGSGFGLHSCANAIIASHGTIEAVSRGPGYGAEFIVLLPVAEQGTDSR